MLLQLGEAEEAAEVLVQATKAAPGNRLLWTMLGMAYRDSLSFKKAKQALQTASQLDPRYGCNIVLGNQTPCTMLGMTHCSRDGVPRLP